MQEHGYNDGIEPLEDDKFIAKIKAAKKLVKAFVRAAAKDSGLTVKSFSWAKGFQDASLIITLNEDASIIYPGGTMSSEEQRQKEDRLTASIGYAFGKGYVHRCHTESEYDGLLRLCVSFQMEERLGKLRLQRPQKVIEQAKSGIGRLIPNGDMMKIAKERGWLKQKPN